MNACWSVAVQGSLKGLVCSELPAVCRGIPHKSRSPLRDYHATFEDCLPVLLLFIWRGIPAFWNDGACNVLQTDSLKQLCRPSIWMLLYEYIAFFFFFLIQPCPLQRHGLVGMVMMVWWLDQVILQVFPNLTDSVILWTPQKTKVITFP